MKLLIVSFRNTCRGPMACGLARMIAAENEVTCEVRTAGTVAHRRGPATLLAVEAMSQVNIDISTEHSKPLTRGLVEWADAVTAVESDLAVGLSLQYPELANKILRPGPDVQDPRQPWATLTDYVNCRDLLEQGLRQLPIWERPRIAQLRSGG